jgi:hypothetical protein
MWVSCLNTSFTLKTEQESTLPFLDVPVNRKPDGSLWHKVYKNAMHTHLYPYSCSRNQPSQKCYSLLTLTWQANIKYELPSTFQTPDGTIQHPKTTFRPTGYRNSMRLSTKDLSNIHDRVAATWNADHLWQDEHASGSITQNWCASQPKRMSHHQDKVEGGHDTYCHPNHKSWQVCST